MARISVTELKPTVISRDLKGKFVCLYGMPKVGKTSLACQFPKNLLVGFEHGWNAISGIKAAPVEDWIDFKYILRDLETQEAKEMYDTITIDTVGIAWDLCEKFICKQNSVQTLGDILWGGGYSACKKEFDSCIRKITQLGYGLVIIAHVDKRIEKRSDDSEVEILAPQIPKRCYEIVNQIVDIIGYIDLRWNDKGEAKRYICTRKTPTIMAGSRFAYLKERIDFGYDSLVQAISDAIEQSQKIDGAVVVDNAVMSEKRVVRSFKEVSDEAKALWAELIEKDSENADRVLKKVEMVFGRKMKLSEINEDQVELFELVLDEMKTL